jgi:hypothetical protein
LAVNDRFRKPEAWYVAQEYERLTRGTVPCARASHGGVFPGRIGNCVLPLAEQVRESLPYTERSET